MSDGVPSAPSTADRTVRGWLMDGLDHHRHGRAAEAGRCYRQALALADDQPDAWHLLGVLRYQGGDPAEALSCIQRALALAPHAASYWSNLGNVLRALGDDARAVQSYQRALELEPAHADAANNLARWHIQGGRDEAARDLLTRLLENQPEHPQALNNLGLLHKKAGALDAAAACFEQALALADAYHDARCNLGNTLLGLGRVDEASACFDTVAQALPADAAVRCDYAVALIQLGRIEEATGQLVLAKTLEPDNPRCRLELGLVYQTRGRLGEAEEEYRAVLELRPEDPEALNNLGTVYRIRGDFDEAMACFGRALAGDPELADAYFNRGTVHADLGRMEEACAELEMSHGLNAGSIAVMENLIHVCHRLGRLDRAEALLDKWLDVAPHDPIACHLRDTFGLGDELPQRCSEDYVRAEFDRAADQFDRRLSTLDYRGPDMFRDHLAQHLPPAAAGTLTVLDAGCGTGLSGLGLKPWARVLAGVDLSPRMLEHAEQRAIYDELECGEIVAHLSAHRSRYHLIAAVDVFNYFGALDALLSAAHAALAPRGRLLFSVEQSRQPDGYVLQDSGRFAHGIDYVQEVLRKSGFADVASTSVMLRLERGVPVWGFLLDALSGEQP